MATLSIAELDAAVGTELGVSPWFEITQDRIDAFGAATDDRQWIHTDPIRAADGPFGATIAHGFLTLSLLTVLGAEVLAVTGVSMGINYGLNRVRFTAPVPVGSRVRGSGRLLEVSDVSGGKQAVIAMTVQVEGSDRPACVAEWLVRYYL